MGSNISYFPSIGGFCIEGSGGKKAFLHALRSCIVIQRLLGGRCHNVAPAEQFPGKMPRRRGRL